jgi:hypothetical protein
MIVSLLSLSGSGPNVSLRLDERPEAELIIELILRKAWIGLSPKENSRRVLGVEWNLLGSLRVNGLDCTGRFARSGLTGLSDGILGFAARPSELSPALGIENNILFI